MVSETQNANLDEKERMLKAVKESQDNFKKELGDLFSNTWNSRISEIKQNIKTVEAERKKGAGSDKEYKAKMDELSK